MSGADSGQSRGNHVQHAPALLRYAQLLTGDPARAAEVVRQTLLRAERDPEVADATPRSARAWLFSDARDMIGAAGSAWPDHPGPDEINYAVDRLLLGDALAQLAAADRDVLRHAYYRRRTTAQIAADLDIDEDAVKQRLHGALRTLFPLLREMGVEPR
jgi:RNA polymerase sigma-70 factor (ECF subfamily)